MIPLTSTLVADPPWKHGDQLPGSGRGAEKHYRCMSTEDICALHLPALEADAILFLWRVASMVPDALRVCKAWGFKPKSELVWVKTSGEVKATDDVGVLPDARLHFGMGRYTRASHEVCIIATRGKAAGLIQRHNVRSVFFAPVGAHSAKPAEFYRIVESLVAGPIVELFAREARGGRWTCLGDSLGTEIKFGLTGGRP